MIPRITILFLFALNVAAATYHISPTGDDSTGDGSLGNPWLTLQKAFDNATSGDTIIQAAGNYTNINAVSKAYLNNITLLGESNSVNWGAGIYICGTNWLTKNISVGDVKIDFLDFTPAFMLETNSSYCVFDSCTVKDSTNDLVRYAFAWRQVGHQENGMWVVRPTNCASFCIVTNCTITNMFGCQSFNVKGMSNLIINCKLIDLDMSDCFFVFGAYNQFIGNVTLNNKFKGSGGLHPDWTQSAGFQQFTAVESASNPYTDSYGHLFKNNKVINSEISFGQLNSDYPSGTNGFIKVGNWTYEGNYFYNSGSRAGSVCSLDIDGCTWTNNTFIYCGTNDATSGDVLTFVVNTEPEYATGGMLKDDYRGTATNITIVNNAFIACGRDTNTIGYVAITGYNLDTNILNWIVRSNLVVHKTGLTWTKKNIALQASPSIITNTSGYYWWPILLNPGTDPLVTVDARPKYGSSLIGNGIGSMDIGYSQFDTNLQVWFTFDEPGTNQVTDSTGYGHNALQTDSTNFLKTTTSIDGSLAALGTIVETTFQGYSKTWYGAITNLSNIEFITNGTVAFWVRKGTNDDARWDTVFDCGYAPASANNGSLATNSWTISYGFSDLRENNTTSFVFRVYGNSLTNDLSHPSLQVSWPTTPKDGITWTHLAAIWTGNSNLVLYYNGNPSSTNTLTSPFLRVSSSASIPWLCLNAQTHEESPVWIYNSRIYGFGKQSLDDIRLYNRVLSGTEIASLILGQSIVNNSESITNPPVQPNDSFSMRSFSIMKLPCLFK